VLDESAKRIVDSYRADIAINRQRMRDAASIPADLLPVDAYQIAFYRKKYLETLEAHNRTLGELSRLLEAGGNAVVDVWSGIHRTEPPPDGRDSGVCSAGPDGNPEG
jgi:hypothetical protein